MAKASASSALGRPAAKKERPTRRSEGIDFSDIPELSTKQLRGMRRVGRPRLGTEPRQLIAIRIDPEVLRVLRRDAARRGIGYQTLINDVLARHARHRAPATPRREA